MDEELTENEREQMRKMAVLQKIARVILSKWKWPLAALFTFSFMCFSALIVWHYAMSAHRYEAKTKLLYNPRQTAKVDNISDKQLLSVLDRPSIKRRVGKMIDMPAPDKECLVIDLSIKQERKPTNLFTLTAHASSWVGAVKKVNAYAEALIEEYTAYRVSDLANWKLSLDTRKKTILDQIAELESEESVLKGQIGAIAPVEALTMLTALLSDQRRNLSVIGVQISNEELKRKKLLEKTGPSGKAIAANGHTIRQKAKELEAIDKELAFLREKFTELNPKIIGKAEEREKKQKEFSEFLAKKGIGSVNIDLIEILEKASQELADTDLRLEVLHENKHNIESEIKRGEKRCSELTAVIPAFERLRVKRADLEQTLRDLDEQIERIDYLEMSVSNDLKQIERAGGAGDSRPLSIKNLAIALGASFASTCIAAIWILALEFLFGKVEGGRELSALADIAFLGSLPALGALSPEEEKDVFGVVALKFVNADMPKNTVLECLLQGAETNAGFNETLDWSLAMSGSRKFSLEIVSAAQFSTGEDPASAPGDGLLNTFIDGAKGKFPVANKYALAPAEYEMLRSDLAKLGGDFDHVFLSLPDDMRRGGSFFDQILSACSSVLIVVMAGVTPRSALSYAMSHIKAAGKPVMAIAAGASAKVAKREMEANK